MGEEREGGKRVRQRDRRGREGRGRVRGRGGERDDSSKDPSKCMVHVYMPIAHPNSSR